MPGVVQHTRESLRKAAAEAAEAGVGGIIVFGIPAAKDGPGRAADDPDGISQVAIADMNGDGMPDLVSADFNVSLFLQTSPGVFASPIALYPGGANWVAVGDLNGDGIPDIALADAVGVKLLMHTGAAGATTQGGSH